MTDGFWFKNTELEYPFAGGDCYDGMRDGLSCFDADITVSNSNWYVENLPTDGLWFNNSQLNYLLVAGYCARVLEDGISSFNVSIQDSVATWGVGSSYVFFFRIELCDL